jgi:hypothetical protein
MGRPLLLKPLGMVISGSPLSDESSIAHVPNPLLNGNGTGGAPPQPTAITGSRVRMTRSARMMPPPIPED